MDDSYLSGEKKRWRSAINVYIANIKSAVFVAKKSRVLTLGL